MSPRARILAPIAALAALLGAGIVFGLQIGGARPTGSVPAHVPPAWKGETLGRTGARVLALEHLPARLELPATEGAPRPDDRTSWKVENLASRSPGVWTGALPFELPGGQKRFAPEGMVVSVDGEPARFATREDLGRRRGRVWWQLAGDVLEIGADHAPKEVRIDYPGLPTQLGRLSWPRSSAAGVTPDDFVHHHVTLGDDTRSGLLLPAPTTATWDVTLPKGARFEGFLTLAPTPLERHSDGADVVLAFRGEDGAEVELGRTTVAGDAAAFTPWKVDLAAAAGKKGALLLRTLPGAADDAVDDAVFVAAPMVVGSPEGDVRRIVVIGIDTLRPDHLSLNGYPRATSPELDAWAKDAVIFDRAWTSAPRTRPSFRSATTGRTPLEAICAKNIGAVFDEAGFATAGIVANVHLNPRFDFHQGFDLWHLDGGAKVDQQVDAAIAWLDEHQDRDSYLFLHVMDPHIFYVAPQPYSERFTSELPALPEGEALPYGRLNRQRVYGMMAKDRLSDLQRQHIVARYDGEIAWTSHELGRLLAHLDALPGRTAVVLHSDHGEEFWEHGGFEHNHTLYDDTTRGVLIVKPPGGAGGRTDVLATLPDIAPTLYDLADLPADRRPETDGTSLVEALRGAAPDPERALPLGYLQYEAERWGVVWHGKKYVLFTGSGKEELYDLQADPGEQHDLSGQVDTAPWWRKMAEVHHVTAGHGWRLHVDVPPGQTLTVRLPADATGADVLDPESVTHRPVNQEWGEVPPVRPADVGTVTLKDPRTLEFVAGSKGEGIVWVLFDQDTPPGGEASLGGEPVRLRAGKVKVGSAELGVRPGIVVVPRESEASRMMSCLAGVRDDAGGQSDEKRLLQTLGYMHGKGGDAD
jgi:arylsulfatase A-like enzyme